MSRGFRRDYQGGPYDWFWAAIIVSVIVGAVIAIRKLLQ